MPLPTPDQVGWVPSSVLNGIQPSGAVITQNILDTFGQFGVDGAPPQHIIDYLAQVGTPWDPAKYSWDPATGNLTDRASGGSWDMRSVPNNSLGSYVALGSGMSPTAESDTDNAVDPSLFGPQFGSAYQFAPGEGPTFFGNPSGPGQIFFSNDPNAIDEYQHDAATRRNQAAAQIAAMIVGGTAATGGFGGGAPAATPAAPVAGADGLSPITVGASTLPGGVPAVTGAGFGATTAATPLAAMPALGAAGAVGGGAAAGGAAAGGNFLQNWLPYITGGVNTLLGYRAADEAADAESAALQAAIDEQRRQYDLNRQDLMPWLTAGQGALNRLQDPNAFTASPGYEWLRNEGQRDIGNSFAARGGAASGNALRALSEFQTGLAQQDYNNWWNREAGLAGVGQNTAVNLGANGANMAGNVSNALANQGISRASGVLGRYSALGQGLQDATANWLYRRPRR